MPEIAPRLTHHSARWLGLVIILALVSGASISLAQNNSTTSPIGEAVTAGPWQMTIVEVLTGADGDAAAANASESNPTLPDGLNYMAIHIQVQNQSQESFRIAPEDFSVVGASGIFRRSAGVFPPSPELDGTVAPGEALDGWVLSSSAANDSDLILLYDSTSITGTWADHAFAISDGAEFNPSEERAQERDRDGRDPAKPVGIGRVIATSEWSIKIVDVVQGAAVNDMSPDETQRLGQSYMSGDGSYASCSQFRSKQPTTAAMASRAISLRPPFNWPMRTVRPCLMCAR